MKILTIVGARPQFIKAALVSRALAETGDVTERIVHTGQHYDATLSAVFFTEMGIPAPSVNLEIGSGTHGAQTGRMLAGIEEVMIAERPDMVLVYGDTNSTLAGALVASKLNVPVAHVEAGLRSWNRRMPEEINRIVTDHVSDLLLAPTAYAASNLENEGVPAARIHVTGDVMLDAVKCYLPAAKDRGILRKYRLERRHFVLATIHRAENTDDPQRLLTIFRGLDEISADIHVIVPLHPRTRAALSRAGLRNAASELTMIEPVGYIDMLALESNAAVVVTDSGGVQKEAFFCGVPCVTVREETEWRELLDARWNRLAPPTSAAALAAAIRSAVGSRGNETAAFGDGAAATRIAAVLTSRAARPSAA